MSEFLDHLQYDRGKIKCSVGLQLPIEMTSYTLPRNMEVYIHNVVEMFLEECHQEQLKENLEFCINELLTNAKKANTKRVYFKEKGLDINNPDDYKVGMENFKMDTLTNIDHYLELQRLEGLYVKLSLKILGDQIHIEIKNNVQMTVFEKQRIQEKLDKVKQYENMDVVFQNVLDQSEGAGLGIIIIILMLQKVGLSKENYRVISTEDETITSIVLPCNRTVYSGVEMLAYEFVNYRDTFPVLKEYFDPVNKIVNEPAVNRNVLYEAIRPDVMLTILALKYAQRADPKCLSLRKALDLISDDDLKFIYSENNPIIEFKESTPRVVHLWDHARRVAYYTYNLYLNSPFKDEIEEDGEYMYQLGLLNILGGVLLLSADDDQMAYLKNLSQSYDNYGEKIFSLFCEGNASTYVSFVAAKKLGFDMKLVRDLQSWNGLSQVPPDAIKRISILHLAEMLQFYDQGMADFYQIDKNVLKDYGIADESQLETLLEKFKAGFEESLRIANQVK